MKARRKFRHWVAIVITLVSIAVSIRAFIDFSGSSAARMWSHYSFVGLCLSMAAITLNLHLDKR